MNQQQRLWLSLIVAVVLSFVSAPAHAQGLGVSVGAAVPVSSLGEYRSIGIRGQISAYSPGGLLRADVGGVLFPGEEDPQVSIWDTGDWRSVSLAVNVLPTISRSESLTFRGVIGLSAQRMSISGQDNPYGTVPGLQLGAFWERPWNGRSLTAEFGLHMVVSDYGVEEYGSSYSIPILVGIKW